MDNNIRNSLVSLGFSQQEINAYEFIYNNGGKFSPTALQNYGYTYEQARRLSYMNKCLMGAVQINTENDMINHYKKMTGASRQDAKQAVYAANLQNGYGAQNYSKEELIKHLKETNGRTHKVNISDLMISAVTDVPRVAVVSGIDMMPYSIWNSNNYKGKDALYRVIDVSGQKITIETNKKPQLQYGAPKSIPNTLEIKGIRQNGQVVVTFDKRVCRLCNRYIVLASLKRPEMHLGMYEMICFEGTKLYIYATNMGIKDRLSYKGGTQRVYAYGVFPGDIKPKTEIIAKRVYEYLHGVSVEYIEPTMDYKVVPSENSDNIDNDEVDF